MFLYFFGTISAQTFYYILRLLRHKTGRKGNGRNGYMRKTECAMTVSARQMNMSHTVAGIINMADAVFLRPCSIINVMKKMSFTEKSQRAEKRRAVECR